jgi:hypothetical protein
MIPAHMASIVEQARRADRYRSHRRGSVYFEATVPVPLRADRYWIREAA